ncbi:MAG: hypothetical protein CL557_12350 [Alphaproteobacteria bacterium]|nr:hypothetical protein [Alphaproteobacteria bacterium]
MHMKEPHMANWNIKETAHAWLNAKTRAVALERAKVRAPHKKAWANMAKAMEDNDVARVTAYTLDFGARISTLVAMQTPAKPKATAKAKAKATPKAKVVAKAVAPVPAEGNGMVEAMANIVGQMDADVQMAFLNLVAKGIAKK